MILFNKLIVINSIFIGYLLANLPVWSAPLQGYVSNPPQLCIQTGKPDKRCPMHKGKLTANYIRGLIGLTYNPATGQILYMYPECGLNQLSIKAGDYILKIEKEEFRPCLMPNVSLYPSGYILNLTIRSKAGIVRTIPVKLIDYRRFTNGDS